MRYRIKHVADGKTHYMVRDQLTHIRVASDGRVEYVAISRSDQAKPLMFWLDNLDANGVKSIYGEWQDTRGTYEVEWGAVINGMEIYENDLIRTRAIVNDSEVMTPPVRAEWYTEYTDTYIVDSMWHVKLVGGVLCCTPAGMIQAEEWDTMEGEEREWNIASHAVLVMTGRITKDTIERSLPYAKWDDEIVDYLMSNAGVKTLDEFIEYMSPKIVGNMAT